MIPYTIRTFRGGISDESDKGVSGAFKHGQSLNIHGRDDILQCGSSVVTVDSTTITDLIQYMVPSADGSLYCFGSTGSIYSVAGQKDDPAVTFIYNDESGEIKGAGEFQLSDGIRYMFWATATQYSRRDMSTGGKDYPWTNVTVNWKTDKISSSAVWHPMAIASGSLMIGNEEGLSTVDFDGNFDPLRLNVRPGNRIKTLEERGDYVVLGSDRSDGSEEGHIWSWIVTAQNYVQKKRIPVQGVNTLVTTENALLQGGDNGEIFPADFENAVALARIPGGGQAYPAGSSILDDIAVFGIFGGTYPGIWSYGRKHKNRPNSLNYEYRLASTVAGSSISTIGAISVLNGNLFASWGTTDGSTSDYGVDQVSSTTRANAIYEGLEFDGGSPHLSKLVDSVALVMSPLVSGTSVSVKFKQNKETDWRYAVLGDATTTFSVANETMAIFNLGKPGRIYEVGVELNASGASSPEIHAIVSYLSKETFEFA